MTNNQCYSYAAQAIANILKSDTKLTPDTFYCELKYLWDLYSEEEIEKIVSRKEIFHELF